MEPILAGILVLALGGAIVIGRCLSQPPRCKSCQSAGEPLPIHHVDGPVPVIEMVYWCPRCAEVVSRRLVTPLWEW